MLPCKCSTSGCERLGILWAKAKTGRKFQTQLRSLLTFSQDRCTKALEVVSVPWQNVEIDCDHLNNTKASTQYYSLCSMKRPRVLSYLPLHLPSQDEIQGHTLKFRQVCPTIHWYPFLLPDGKKRRERREHYSSTQHDMNFGNGIRAWWLTFLTTNLPIMPGMYKIWNVVVHRSFVDKWMFSRLSQNVKSSYQ